ncbi:MAG: ABC transporter substrate-binding protein, partial [Patescibacteria group bacterium]
MTYKELRALFLRRFNIPKARPVARAIRSFTTAEKAVFYFFTAVFILSGFIMLWQVSDAFLVEVPVRGGALAEGVVGNPRFINPVLAFSEADKNLTALVYSGLARLTPEGEIANDLAESISVSQDKRVYTAVLRADARFHDDTKITADDVIFTISKIADPVVKSPRRGNWDDVTVEKIDERTVKFTLKRAYAPFIYNLTVGILPKRIWHNVTNDEFSFSQFNTLPVGSGPFEVARVERNEGGIPDYYGLEPFGDSSGKKPYIKNLVFRFYPSETALIKAYNDGSVDAISGVSPENLEKLDERGSRVVRSSLPRIFAVFWNQTKSKVLQNKEVRRALGLAAPKERIVETILKGYATPIDGPIPAGIYGWSSERQNTEPYEKRLELARQILTKDGWVLDLETGVLEKKSKSGNMTLSFSISTDDTPELNRVAEELKGAWEKLGAKVEILVYERGDLNQNVIQPRQFEGLLFGEVVSRDADVYPFWH